MIMKLNKIRRDDWLLLADGLLARLISVVFVLGSSLSVLTGQSTTFRGTVEITFFEIPIAEIDHGQGVVVTKDHLARYATGQNILYDICGDTIYMVNTLPANNKIFKIQYGNSTMIDTRGGGRFVEFPKLPSFLANVRSKDWRKYNSSKRKSVFKPNFELILPDQRQFSYIAEIDLKTSYLDQYNLGGDFTEIFHPFGIINWIVGEIDSIYYTRIYNYIYKEDLNCREVFSSIRSLRTVGSVPHATVYYQADTVVNFNAPRPIFDIGEVYDTSLTLLPSINGQTAKYTYVEIYTDDCPVCADQSSFIISMQDSISSLDIGFASIYVSSSPNLDKWSTVLSNRPGRYGSDYMMVSSRNSLIGSELNLSLLPRYLILDQDGRIVMQYAPRPSDSRLQQVINQLRNTE